MNGKSKPYAILVFGAPMSGKTTFAEQFSNRFSTPFLNLSELHEKFHIPREAARVLIAEFSKCHQTLIIEGGLNTEKQREEMRRILQKNGYSSILVWVQTDVTTIKHRMHHKYHTLAAAKTAFDAGYKHIEAPTEVENALVISGKHTFQTQCKNVLTGISERTAANDHQWCWIRRDHRSPQRLVRSPQIFRFYLWQTFYFSARKH